MAHKVEPVEDSEAEVKGCYDEILNPVILDVYIDPDYIACVLNAP